MCPALSLGAPQNCKIKWVRRWRVSGQLAARWVATLPKGVIFFHVDISLLYLTGMFPFKIIEFWPPIFIWMSFVRLPITYFPCPAWTVFPIISDYLALSCVSQMTDPPGSSRVVDRILEYATNTQIVLILALLRVCFASWHVHMYKSDGNIWDLLIKLWCSKEGLESLHFQESLRRKYPVWVYDILVYFVYAQIVVRCFFLRSVFGTVPMRRTLALLETMAFGECSDA